MANEQYGAIRLTIGEKTKREFVAAAEHYETTPSGLAKIVLRRWLDEQPANVKLHPDRFRDDKK